MGEQNYSYSSNPEFSVIMRNSRGKLFMYVAALGVLCFIVFLYSSTHTSLKELEGLYDKCQQQRDSFSAQLQVVYEHKNRLEKSLQQEKTDHKHTKEGNDKQVSDLENKFQKEKDDKQKLEMKVSQLKNSYSELDDEKTKSENALREELKNVHLQKDGEIKKLQAHITDLLAEKEKLEASNNEFLWKFEQHASEVNLCQLQLQQAKAEVHTCQEQIRLHNFNTMNTNTIDKIPENRDKAPAKVEDYPQPQERQDAPNEIPVLPIKKPVLPGENDVVPVEYQTISDANYYTSSVLAKAAQENIINVTASPPHEKVSVLDKPRLMPANHLADGVLPKPLDLKPEIQVSDAAAEVVESKRKSKPIKDPLVHNIVDRYAEMRNNLLNEDKKDKAALDVAAVGVKEQENHPQVAAPNFDNVEDKDDHAGERGEDGNQYNPDAKPQVEEPVLGKQNPQPKELFAGNAQDNDIAAQMNDMMNKSPGNINNAVEQNVLRVPPHLENHKNQLDFKNEAAFVHRGADHRGGMDDKNYEEDDDDRENDDEPLNGLAPAAKVANNMLQDNDFDDQENQDIADNAKEEEGVVVAPK